MSGTTDHRARGVSRRASLAILSTGAATTAFWTTGSAASRYKIEPDIVVAKDGSGHFRSIHAALQSIAPDNSERKIVLVKDGLYDEAVRLDAPYVTLRGQSRQGTRLERRRPAEGSRDDIGPGVFNTSSTAHDLVLENLTIRNSVETVGPHAFAVFGRSDRVIIQDAEILSLGADTLALWRTAKTKEEIGRSEGAGATRLTEDGGRYYHRNLRVIGSVDFICPRGWCYLADSEIGQVYPGAEAAFWHEGSNLPSKKFVIRNCHVDGPPDFYLARSHRDAHFYFIDCRFSERLRDKPPYFVTYPLDGKAPSPGDLAANAKAASETRFGSRNYFHNTHKIHGDYPWMVDNLATAAGTPSPAAVTAKWTFDGTWDPEAREGPRVIAVKDGALVALTFDRLVTVKGAPELVLEDGAVAVINSAQGNVVTFARPKAAKAAAPSHLRFALGAIIATEATASILLAEARLPRPSAV